MEVQSFYSVERLQKGVEKMKKLLICCPSCHQVHEVTIENTWVDTIKRGVFKARWTDDDGVTRDHLLNIEDYKMT